MTITNISVADRMTERAARGEFDKMNDKFPPITDTERLDWVLENCPVRAFIGMDFTHTLMRNRVEIDAAMRREK